MIGKRSRSSARVAPNSSSENNAAPRRRFSRTVIFWNSRRPSGTSDNPRRTGISVVIAVMSLSSKMTRPRDLGARPTMALRVLDLPAPFAPTRPSASPRRWPATSACSRSGSSCSARPAASSWSPGWPSAATRCSST